MAKKKHPKVANINVRCTPELKALAEAAALDDGRSITGYIVRLIEKDARVRPLGPEYKANRKADAEWRARVRKKGAGSDAAQAHTPTAPRFQTAPLTPAAPPP